MKKYLAIIIILSSCGYGQYPHLGIKKGKIVDLNQRIVNNDSSLKCK